MISYGKVSQNVFDNAVKSWYARNRKVQGFSIASSKAIDDSLIRFAKKIQLQRVIIGLAIVVFILAVVLITHKVFELTKRLSPFATILSYNPNCAFPPPLEISNWETTRKEIQPIPIPNPNGTIEIDQRKIDEMFREVQQAIDGASRSETRADTFATQQRIFQAINDLLPPPPPNNTTPLQYPIRPNTNDLREWRYDINRYLTGSPDKSPTARQWQDFKNGVIQKVRQSR
jgi:hypothetical protein